MRASCGSWTTVTTRTRTRAGPRIALEVLDGVAAPREPTGPEDPARLGRDRLPVEGRVVLQQHGDGPAHRVERVVAIEGFPFEYLPSRGDLGIGPRRWNALFSERLGELLGRVRPAAVLFDGTYPYQGLVERTREVPDTRLVWSRRAMWKAGLGARQLKVGGRVRPDFGARRASTTVALILILVGVLA